MFYRFMFFFLIAFASNVSNAQTKSYIDSLKAIASSKAHDSVLYNAHNKIAIAYSDSAYLKSLEHWKLALSISQKTRNREQMAYLYGRMGQMLFEKGEFAEALDLYENALAIYEFVDDTKGKAISYNDIGLVYKTWGRYDLALENYLLAIKLFNEINHEEGLAIASNNIGQIYYYRENYVKSIEYFSAYLKVNEKNRNVRAVAGASNNIAAAYMAINEYDLALEYYQKALIIYDSLNILQGVAILKDNIGSLYAAKESFTKALEYHHEALNIFDQISIEPRKAYALKNIGYSHYKLGNNVKSIESLLQSVKIAHQYKQLETLKEVYSILSEVYQRTNEYKNSLHYFKLFNEIKDSLANEETQEKLAKLELQYQSQIKNQELELIYNKLEQNKTLWFIVIFLVVIFIFLSVLVLVYGKKQKELLKVLQTQKNNLLLVSKSIAPVGIEKNKVILDALYPNSIENFGEEFFHIVSSQGEQIYLLTFHINKQSPLASVLYGNLKNFFEEVKQNNSVYGYDQLLEHINIKLHEINDIYELKDISYNLNLLLFDAQQNKLYAKGDLTIWIKDGSEFKTTAQKSEVDFSYGFHSKTQVFLLYLNDIKSSMVRSEFEHKIERTLMAVSEKSIENQKEILKSTLDGLNTMYDQQVTLLIVSFPAISQEEIEK